MVRISDITVTDLIKPAKTISPETEISEAIRIMKREVIDFLSVVDDGHRLVGVVSESSFMKMVKHEPQSPIGDPLWFDSIEPEAGKQPVSSVMTTEITTIKPNDNMGMALRIMDSTGYKLFHVVDPDGKLLGTIRIKDIFEKLLEI